jgi:hypothetical protein
MTEPATSETTPAPAPHKRKRVFMLWVAVDIILGITRLVVVFSRRRSA